MEPFSIGELARRAGIRPSAIRYYERVNVLPTPQRVNGQRSYDEGMLRRLAVIQLAQRLGFTIAEMRVLFSNGETEDTLPGQWPVLAHQKLAEVEALTHQAMEMKKLLQERLHCDCIDCLLRNYADPDARRQKGKKQERERRMVVEKSKKADGIVIPFQCPHCGNDVLVRNGRAPNGKQKYRCRACQRQCREHSTPHAYPEERRAEILRIYEEHRSLRGVERTFGVSRTTVIGRIKNGRRADS